MSNVHYDLFCLADIPDLTQLDRQLLGHMCTRFNEKENPPKAWPGADELRRITGAEPESNSRGITRLVRKGYLHRVTRPRKGTGTTRGNRSEVAPNLKLIASHVHLTEELSNKNKKVLDLLHNLTNEPVIDNPVDVFTYPTGYAKPIEPIEPIINVNKPRVTNNVNKINFLRWNVVVTGLPENLRNYVKPGGNYETLLDQCEANGMKATEIRRSIGNINFGNSYNVGGLLNDVLQGLAGVKRASKSKWRLDHCGRENCDPETRTFPEPSEINGHQDHRCDQCNDHLVDEIKRLKDRKPLDLEGFQNFGRSPDDV